MKVSLTKGYFVGSMSLLSPQNEWREQAQINYLISRSPEEVQRTCTFEFPRDWDVQECSSVTNIDVSNVLTEDTFSDMRERIYRDKLNRSINKEEIDTCTLSE